MLALVLFITFGLLFGYFATLNTTPVTVHFGYNSYTIPLYVLVLLSLGFGIIFAAIFYVLKSIATGFAFSRKESELDRLKKETTELTKTIHQLELENTRLKTKNGEESEDDSL